MSITNKQLLKLPQILKCANKKGQRFPGHKDSEKTDASVAPPQLERMFADCIEIYGQFFKRMFYFRGDLCSVFFAMCCYYVFTTSLLRTFLQSCFLLRVLNVFIM